MTDLEKTEHTVSSDENEETLGETVVTEVSDKASPDKKIVYVVDENLPGRNRAMAIFLMPMFVLLSGFIGIPFVATNTLNITVSVLTTIAAELIAITIALRYTRSTPEWKQVLKLQNFKLNYVLIGAGTGFAMFWLLQGAALLLNEIGLPIGSSETSIALGGTEGFARILIYFIFVPIVIPFVEEIFFRGAIMSFAQRGFKSKKVGTIAAILISSVGFGFAHTQGFSTFDDFFTIAWTGFVGLISSIMVLKYDSIYPAYALHLFYNGTTVLATTLLTSM